MSIPASEIEAVSDRAFLSSSRACDRAAALAAFVPWIEAFWFCDPDYREAASAEAEMPPHFRLCNRRVLAERDPGGPALAAPAAAARPGRRRVSPPRDRDAPEPHAGPEASRRAPRWRAQERYVSEGEERVVTVTLWRDRAEEMIEREFLPRSIGIFMHRRGGVPSGVPSDVPGGTRGAPLFPLLAPRLADRALFLSDASAEEAVVPGDARPGSPRDRWGFRWTCIGRLAVARDGRAPALVWRLERLASRDGTAA